MKKLDLNNCNDIYQKDQDIQGDLYYLDFVKDKVSLINKYKDILFLDFDENIYYYVVECKNVTANGADCDYQMEIS